MSDGDLADRVARLAERSKAKRAAVVEQAAVESAAAEVDREAKRAALREQMPAIAGVVDRFSAVFGEGSVRVVYANENGKEIKTKAYRAS